MARLAEFAQRAQSRVATLMKVTGCGGFIHSRDDRLGIGTICPPLAADAYEFCHFAMTIIRAGENKRPRVGIGAMQQQGDAAYAMAIESAALAVTACDLRLRPQLNEAFSEALELRGGVVGGNTCIISEVIAVLDDVFARVIALHSEDLAPAHEHVLRERAEKLVRRILSEFGTDSVLHWPFAVSEREHHD